MNPTGLLSVCCISLVELITGVLITGCSKSQEKTAPHAEAVPQVADQPASENPEPKASAMLDLSYGREEIPFIGDSEDSEKFDKKTLLPDMFERKQKVSKVSVGDAKQLESLTGIAYRGEISSLMQWRKRFRQKKM